MHKVTINKAEPGDLNLLFTICRQSYSENFADHWSEGGLEWYLEKVYGREVIKSELNNPEVNYYIAFIEDQPVGFMKLNSARGLPGDSVNSGMEIEKIYFRPHFQGKGIGKRFIDVAIDLGKKLNKDIIWLGVIDKNTSAIEFYKKMGFTFHDKIKLDIPYFKEHLKGMWRMILQLN